MWPPTNVNYPEIMKPCSQRYSVTTLFAWTSNFQCWNHRNWLDFNRQNPINNDAKRGDDERRKRNNHILCRLTSSKFGGGVVKPKIWAVDLIQFNQHWPRNRVAFWEGKHNFGWNYSLLQEEATTFSPFILRKKSHHSILNTRLVVFPLFLSTAWTCFEAFRLPSEVVKLLLLFIDSRMKVTPRDDIMYLIIFTVGGL